MATFNLVRNSRVFFTTNVAAGTGVVAGSGFTTANTQEIQVMDGFSFSQASNADTVTINEAGSTPVRGQRSFNTSLGNVEFSFSTYIRPRIASALVEAEESHLWNALLASVPVVSPQTGGGFATSITTVVGNTATGSLSVTGVGLSGVAVGDILIVKGVGKTVNAAGSAQWNTAIKILTVTGTTAFTAQYLSTPTVTCPGLTSWAFGDIVFTKTAWNTHVAQTSDTSAPQFNALGVAYSSISTALSNKNQLLTFGMIITVDGVTYVIDNCAMDQAVVDFGLDGIAMVAWTGKGTVLRQLATNITYSAAANPVMSGGVTGTATGKITTANFITNKLSTVTLISTIAGLGTSPVTYTLALTGGSITIANNITYVTPANLGVVNVPIGYFTGTRAVSGSLTAYLRSGNATGSGSTGNSTATLLNDILAASATSAGVEPKYRMQVEIGGSANATRIEVDSRGAFLQVPTIDTQAVMSTTINFTSQGSDTVTGATAGYDIENTNDLLIRYLSAA